MEFKDEDKILIVLRKPCQGVINYPPFIANAGIDEETRHNLFTMYAYPQHVVNGTWLKYDINSIYFLRMLLHLELEGVNTLLNKLNGLGLIKIEQNKIIICN